MKKILIVIMLIATVVYGADKKTSNKKPASVSPTLPIDLVADKGSYDQVAGVAVYEGNVKLTQGASIIWADKLMVFLKDNAADRVEAIGKPVHFEYKGDKQPITGSGEHAIYHVVPKIVTLVGNAVVKQGADTVKGNQLTYDLTKEIIGGTRVKMTFLPRNDKD